MALQIREEIEPYSAFFDGKKCNIAPENTHNLGQMIGYQWISVVRSRFPRFPQISQISTS